MNTIVKLALASLVAVSAKQISAYPPNVIVLENDTDRSLIVKIEGQEFKHAPGKSCGYEPHTKAFDGQKVKYCKICTEDGLLIKALEYETWEAHAPEIVINGEKRRLVYHTFTTCNFKVSEFMEEFKKREEERAKLPVLLGYGKLKAKL